MKQVISFFRHYKLFTLAVVSMAVAGVLELSHYHTAAHWLLGTVAILETIPLVWDMWHEVRSGRYGIDILAITAIVTAVLLHQYWAAIVVVVMLTGGESLEDFAQRRAKRELDSLLAHAPRTATVVRKNKTLTLPVEQIRPNDKVIIKPGEVVPVDAVIIEGTASFDESSLTGESLPVTKQSGDTILSGSIDVDGPVTAKATATAADSQYQQIISLVQSAMHSQAPFVRLAERYSLPFTLTAFAIASAVWVVSGEAIRFLEVIIVATPCPLLLAAPIALISGMSRASRYGIIIKNGGALERLAEAEAIAFDKTGTLTRGELTVDTVTAFGDTKKDEVIRLCASLEQNSNHVVAQALVNYATTKKIKLAKAKHVREIPGRGVRAILQGKSIVVGRLSLLEEEGVQLPTKFKASSVKQTALYIAIDGVLSGVVTFKDELRPEAATTLDRLRSGGLGRMLMVTGDNAATAEAVGEQLGIEEIHAEALPADKLHLLDRTDARPLVFVGDGINDAPVLTSADVGIALGARGSTAASESADMVVMLDDLSRVADAYEIARRTFKIARQSILYGIALSIILMLVFATGKFPPLLGAILQEVVDVVVIFNALRAHLITVD